MAALEDLTTAVIHPLHARTLLGRSPLAQLRLQDSCVSAEHAIVGWDGAGWVVQDLGSRNGTLLDDQRLPPRVRTPLRVGSVLTLGHARCRLRLREAGPPQVLAIPLDGGAARCGDAELLALPSPEQPEVTVLRDRSGQWVLDREGARAVVGDGAVVAAGGLRFTLHLPDLLPSTREEEAPRAELRVLVVRHSADEEFIQVSCVLEERQGARTLELGARAHHALLLALARERLSDQARGVAAGEQGFVHMEDLCQRLGQDESHCNVMVFRCRQQLATAGVPGAAELIERRKPTRQLRVAVARVEVLPL